MRLMIVFLVWHLTFSFLQKKDKSKQKEKLPVVDQLAKI